MAQINKPNEYFNPVLYTGNESTNAITTGLANDFVWVKAKDSGGVNHYLFDSVRGVQKNLHSNTTDAEATEANTLTAFNSTGFTLGSDAQVNGSGQPHISWNWKAGGTAVSNTDGSITSSVSANTTAGFSIVSYTGNGTGSATFGHNLGATPKVVIIKRTDVQDGWQFWFNNTIRLGLNVTNGDYGNNPISTSSTLVTTPSGVDTVWNTNGGSYISYCFAPKSGFSSMGQFTGNGNADGTFVYTGGMKPAWVMIKRTNAAQAWMMYDNKRSVFNTTNDILYANTSGAESVDNSVGIDFLSNGFKCRSGDDSINGSGDSYIFMCFAENPLVGTNGVPATAR